MEPIYHPGKIERQAQAHWNDTHAFRAVEIAGHRLKLAVRGARADLAFAVIIGQEQLDHGAPRGPHARGGGVHFHVGGDRRRARGLQRPCALDFHDADAAETGTAKVDILDQVAKDVNKAEQDAFKKDNA